ncbi:hypothetical protein VTK26DRAFT_4771 [Humicola hyalothermophila]
MAPLSFTVPPNRHLAPEIITEILAQSLTEPDICGFSLLCPEWGLCQHRHQSLEALLRSTRVDTYTLPLAGGGVVAPLPPPNSEKGGAPTLMIIPPPLLLKQQSPPSRDVPVVIVVLPLSGAGPARRPLATPRPTTACRSPGCADPRGPGGAIAEGLPACYRRDLVRR